MFVFQSRWLGLTKWLGSTKIKFSKGIYQTSDEKVAAFLRQQKECSEVVSKPAEKPAEEPAKSKK